MICAMVFMVTMSASARQDSGWDLIVDPTVVTTVAIGFGANVVPETIATNDSGLIFALCINYLMIEDRGSSFDRAAKFAASYIAGAVVGRVTKACMKLYADQNKPAWAEKNGAEKPKFEFIDWFC